MNSLDSSRAAPAKVLVATQDDGVRLTRAAVLTNAGFRVTSAKRKEEALALIGQHSFDVLVVGNSFSGQGCRDISSAFRTRFPKGRVIEVVSGRFDAPLCIPDEAVVGLDGPAVLISAVHEQLSGKKKAGLSPLLSDAD